MVFVATSPVALPAFCMASRMVGSTVPSGRTEIMPLLVLWPVAMAVAAAAESVTRLSRAYVVTMAAFGNVSNTNLPSGPRSTFLASCSAPKPIPSPMHRMTFFARAGSDPAADPEAARATELSSTTSITVTSNRTRPRFLTGRHLLSVLYRRCLVDWRRIGEHSPRMAAFLQNTAQGEQKTA